MIVGTTGFSWSGSSAVADLLMEYENFQIYDREFILAYYPDGIEDLDYHLNTNCSKHLSSTVAIPRFRRAVNYLLKEDTNGKIKKLTDQYLDKLVQVRWYGFGQGQELRRNLWCLKHFGTGFTFKLRRRLPPWICKRIHLYPLTNMEFSVQPDHFLELTQKYIENILKCLGMDLNKNIVLDQPFAGNDPVKSMKYFKDSKAIIVDRDPRELYLLAKEYFPKTSWQVPHDRVEDFIAYYKHMHKTLPRSQKDPNVLYLHFEDMIYEYDATKKRIEDFLNLGVHVAPKTCFQPEVSMANTRLYQKCKKYHKDIKKIEEELSEYIYDFEAYTDLYQYDNGKMFEGSPSSGGYKWKR